MSADGSRIYLGRIPHRAREKDVERFFKGFGKITDIILKNGFAFVDFEDARDADDAAYELNGKEILGDRVLVEIARGTPHGRDRFLDQQKRQDRRGYGGYDRRDRRSRSRSGGRDRRRATSRSRSDGYKVIVENLSSRVSKQELKDLFRKYGDVSYVEANSRRKNEGVVEFVSKSDMKKAIDKLDGYELNGREIKLIGDKRAKSVSRSRSKSRSASRSRSKSVDAEPRENGDRRSKSKSASRSRSRSASADEMNGHGGDADASF